MRVIFRILSGLLLLTMLAGTALVEFRRSACRKEKRESLAMERRFAGAMNEWHRSREQRADYYRLRFFLEQPARALATGADWMCRVSSIPDSGWRLEKLRWELNGNGIGIELIGSADDGLEEGFSQAMRWFSEQSDLVVMETERYPQFKRTNGAPGFLIRGNGEMQ